MSLPVDGRSTGKSMIVEGISGVRRVVGGNPALEAEGFAVPTALVGPVAPVEDWITC